MCQAAPWMLTLPAQSFLIREHELVPGESEAGTLLGQRQELQERLPRSVLDGLLEAVWPLMEPGVSNNCLPFEEKRICVGKLTNNEIEKDARKATVWWMGSPGLGVRV